MQSVSGSHNLRHMAMSCVTRGLVKTILKFHTTCPRCSRPNISRFLQPVQVYMTRVRVLRNVNHEYKTFLRHFYELLLLYKSSARSLRVSAIKYDILQYVTTPIRD